MAGELHSSEMAMADYHTSMETTPSAGFAERPELVQSGIEKSRTEKVMANIERAKTEKLMTDDEQANAKALMEMLTRYVN